MDLLVYQGNKDLQVLLVTLEKKDRKGSVLMEIQVFRGSQAQLGYGDQLGTLFVGPQDLSGFQGHWVLWDLKVPQAPPA